MYNNIVIKPSNYKIIRNQTLDLIYLSLAILLNIFSIVQYFQFV